MSSNDARIKHHSHAVSWRTRGEGGHKKKSGRAGHALAESHAVVHLHVPFTLGASGRHAGGRDPWGLRPPSRAVGSLRPTDFQEADTRHNVQHGVPRESRVECLDCVVMRRRARRAKLANRPRRPHAGPVPGLAPCPRFLVRLQDGAEPRNQVARRHLI